MDFEDPYFVLRKAQAVAYEIRSRVGMNWVKRFWILGSFGLCSLSGFEAEHLWKETLMTRANWTPSHCSVQNLTKKAVVSRVKAKIWDKSWKAENVRARPGETLLPEPRRWDDDAMSPENELLLISWKIKRIWKMDSILNSFLTCCVVSVILGVVAGGAPAKVIEGFTGFEDVEGWNKKSDDTTGLEEKLGGKVVFWEKFDAGNDLGERLVDKEGSREELENLVCSGENLGSGLVLATSEGSGGACWTIVTFGKVSWSLFASHTVGFSAEQLTSWRRTPSWQKVPSFFRWRWWHERRFVVVLRRPSLPPPPLP